jgi:ParB-like chromosome segregation protein Spo0J
MNTGLSAREVLFLRPEQITTEDKFNVRPFGDGENPEAIEQLALSIERDGQQDAGIVIPVEATENGEKITRYVLISGHRRRRAISFLNERYAINGKSLIEMRVEVDRSGGDHLRKAIVSNLHRKDFSPMDLATLIHRIKAENGWDSQAYAGTKKVAAYLSVSPATVIQHEKFLTVDGDLQKRLHNGDISAQSALDLIAIAPDKRDEVLGRAAAIQAEENRKEAAVKAEKAAASGKVPKIPVPEATSSNSAPSVESKPEKTRIERPAVVKAIRETSAQTVIPRTRKEIVEFFTSLDGPAYGYVDSDVRQFIAYFGKWQSGNGTDRTLLAKFDAMVEKSNQGTKEAQAKADKAEAARIEKEEANKAEAKAATKAEKAAAKPAKTPKSAKEKTAEPSKPKKTPKKEVEAKSKSKDKAEAIAAE